MDKWIRSRLSASPVFFGAIADHSHHCECEHHEGDIATPAIPRAGLVVMEAEFVLGGLEVIFNCPTVTLYGYERLNAISGRVSGREECKIGIAYTGSHHKPRDQNPARVSLY